jgi:hypothetical protein
MPARVGGSRGGLGPWQGRREGAGAQDLGNVRPGPARGAAGQETG